MPCTFSNPINDTKVKGAYRGGEGGGARDGSIFSDIWTRPDEEVGKTADLKEWELPTWNVLVCFSFFPRRYNARE